LRIKEQETRLTLQEHDDDDDDKFSPPPPGRHPPDSDWKRGWVGPRDVVDVLEKRILRVFLVLPAVYLKL